MEKVLILGGTGLVGKRIANSLQDTYRVVVTSGHHKVDNGYICKIEDVDRLLEILELEQPEIVISSLRGDFGEQIKFHEVLGKWLSDHKKRMVFISSMNVFDGDISAPVDENTIPYSDSEYGNFKIYCERLLQHELQDSLAILRLGAVWDCKCKRIDQLKENSTIIKTWTGHMITQTLASQVGVFTKYFLDNKLSGIFHVGTEDMVDYHQFELLVCDRLHIPYPKFQVTKMEKQTYQVFSPTIRNIPFYMKLTVEELLCAISKSG